jgi:hypothetical protein
MSDSRDPNALASRDIDSGNCAFYGYGCRMTGNTYLCCCNRNRCNSAITNYKLNFFILFLSFNFILLNNV